jgi:hypothetical protein
MDRQSAPRAARSTGIRSIGRMADRLRVDYGTQLARRPSTSDR